MEDNKCSGHLSNVCFCVNMKFSYMIAGLKGEIYWYKDEMSYCNENKRFFCWYLGQLFVDDI